MVLDAQYVLKIMKAMKSSELIKLEQSNILLSFYSRMQLSEVDKANMFQDHLNQS